MANCCPVCKSDITEFLADRWHCLGRIGDEVCGAEWSTNTVPRTVYTHPGPRGAEEITPQSADVQEENTKASRSRKKTAKKPAEAAK